VRASPQPTIDRNWSGDVCGCAVRRNQVSCTLCRSRHNSILGEKLSVPDELAKSFGELWQFSDLLGIHDHGDYA